MKQKYGSVALVAGASEGIGAAFANGLAARGFDIILVARRKEPLMQVAAELEKKYGVKTTVVTCDLADTDATEQIQRTIGDIEVDVLVYNAALPYIGPYLKVPAEHHRKIAAVNVLTPLSIIHHFGERMVQRKRGAVIVITSLAGMQGAGFLTTYAATKAFGRILAESLWYEWKNKGVDVIGCIAGATSTPGYISSKPKPASTLAPPVQTPEAVMEECLKKLGKVPSFISGGSNKLASFFMNHILSVKAAVTIMGDTTRKMYGMEKE